MKKLIAILLIAVLALSLTACGGGSTGAKSETGLWKVTYPDGRVEYYDVFENGSEKLSVRPAQASIKGLRMPLDFFSPSGMISSISSLSKSTDSVKCSLA